MKHKTWFRLVLQAIGVLLVGFCIPTLLQTTIGFLDLLIADGGWTFISPYGVYSNVRNPGDPSPYWTQFWYAFPYVAQFAFGLYLMCGGKWLLNKIIPSNRPYCPECGYDLTKNKTAKCPECGVALTSSANAQSNEHRGGITKDEP